MESSVTCNLSVNYDSFKSTFFMLNLAFNVLLSNVLVKQIGILCFLQYRDYKNILLFALFFDMHFFYKNLVVLLYVIIIFYFDICIKFALWTIISSMKKRYTSPLMCVITSLWWKCYNFHVITFMFFLYMKHIDTFWK